LLSRLVTSFTHSERPSLITTPSPPGPQEEAQAWVTSLHGPPHLHRAAAGRLLPGPAGGGAGHRGGWLRRLLSLRPRHGLRRRRPARTHRLLGDAGGAGPRDDAREARDAGDVDDLPRPRHARHRRRSGRRPD